MLEVLAGAVDAVVGVDVVVDVDYVAAVDKTRTAAVAAVEGRTAAGQALGIDPD